MSSTIEHHEPRTLSGEELERLVEAMPIGGERSSSSPRTRRCGSPSSSAPASIASNSPEPTTRRGEDHRGRPPDRRGAEDGALTPDRDHPGLRDVRARGAPAAVSDRTQRLRVHQPKGGPVRRQTFYHRVWGPALKRRGSRASGSGSFATRARRWPGGWREPGPGGVPARPRQHADGGAALRRTVGSGRQGGHRGAECTVRCGTDRGFRIPSSAPKNRRSGGVRRDVRAVRALRVPQPTLLGSGGSGEEHEVHYVLAVLDTRAQVVTPGVPIANSDATARYLPFFLTCRENPPWKEV